MFSFFSSLEGFKVYFNNFVSNEVLVKKQLGRFARILSRRCSIKKMRYEENEQRKKGNEMLPLFIYIPN